MDGGDADAVYRAWMREALERGASEGGVTVAGEPVFGWRDRSIGAPVQGPEGVRWLRVVTERIQFLDDHYWTGNAASPAIDGVCKPEVLSVHEWVEGPQRLRAETMTFIPAKTCAPTDALRQEIDLPETWWAGLRRAVDMVSAVPTTRRNVGQDRVSRRLRVFFGDTIDPVVRRWTTAHGDLHWANVTAPELCVLDWEGWGTGPLGLDAATLHCYTLLAPRTAERVHATFADVLDTPDGVRAHLYAIARLLLRAEHGDHPDLILPLHRVAAELLKKAAGA